MGVLFASSFGISIIWSLSDPRYGMAPGDIGSMGLLICSGPGEYGLGDALVY